MAETPIHPSIQRRSRPDPGGSHITIAGNDPLPAAANHRGADGSGDRDPRGGENPPADSAGLQTENRPRRDRDGSRDDRETRAGGAGEISTPGAVNGGSPDVDESSATDDLGATGATVTEPSVFKQRLARKLERLAEDKRAKIAARKARRLARKKTLAQHDSRVKTKVKQTYQQKLKRAYARAKKRHIDVSPTVHEAVAAADPDMVATALRRSARKNRKPVEFEPVTEVLARDALAQRASELGLPIVSYGQSITMAVRRMHGGRQQFFSLIALAASAKDAEAMKFLTVFMELKAEHRARAAIEDICVAAGVSPVALIKTCAGIAFEHSVDLSTMMRALAAPEIVAASIASAKRIEGAHADIALEDRKLLHQGQGFIPVPKSASINLNVNAQATAAAASTSNGPSFLRDAQISEQPRQSVQSQIIDGELTPKVDKSMLPDVNRPEIAPVSNASLADEPIDWPSTTELPDMATERS